MRINTKEGLETAKRLYLKYGSWKAVRAALAKARGERPC